MVRNKGKGFGFVCFKEAIDVQQALSFPNHEIFGKVRSGVRVFSTASFDAVSNAIISHRRPSSSRSPR